MPFDIFYNPQIHFSLIGPVGMFTVFNLMYFVSCLRWSTFTSTAQYFFFKMEPTMLLVDITVGSACLPHRPPALSKPAQNNEGRGGSPWSLASGALR